MELTFLISRKKLSVILTEFDTHK